MKENAVSYIPPTGFVPEPQWPESDPITLFDNFLNPKQVGTSPLGIRYSYWPLQIESYTSYDEPKIETSSYFGRIILWDGYIEQTPPKGWYAFLKRPAGKVGYTEIDDTTDYIRTWSPRSRTYRNKWLRDYEGKSHRIEQVSYEDFEKGYRESRVVRRIGATLLKFLERRLSSPKPNVDLWCVRKISDGKIVAGMAVSNSILCRSSYYICGFESGEKENGPTMVGLMNNWFSECQKKNIRLLLFGYFWTKGNPKSWKGFSIFKAHFGTKYFYLPPTLFRYKRGIFI